MNMKLIYYFLFSLILSLTATSLPAEDSDKRSHYVLVTVAPHRFFVQKIAGDSVTVGLMVPAGASAHTFEPTPKETIKAANADIWFRIGESFEDKAIHALKSHNSRLDVVDLRDGLDLISDPTHVCIHHKGCMDLHFWLSPKMAKTQAETMTAALSRMYPEHQGLYNENLNSFEKELDEMDLAVKNLLKDLKNRTIMVSHPAYGYLARDYNLSQFSIEFEGKDPTPKLLTKILNEAREKNIKIIFTQPQYNNKGAHLIAKEIGAKTVSLDPYSENYFESLLNITKHFADQ